MTNKEVLTKFYSAFQKLDSVNMKECYSDEAIFQDPAFGILNGEEVKSMWEMLCKNAKDFSLTFDNIEVEDEEYITCRWIATYTFSATGRSVVNNIKAYMRVKDGKIIEHTDYFNFWKWSRQALGLSGWLLGWSSFFKIQVSKQARERLFKYMEKNGAA
jgi:ketosteroid isomerase-like protein